MPQSAALEVGEPEVGEMNTDTKLRRHMSHSPYIGVAALDLEGQMPRIAIAFVPRTSVAVSPMRK